MLKKSIILILAFVSIIFCFDAHARISVADEAKLTAINILENGGFEAGKTKWSTNSSEFDIVTTTSLVGTPFRAASYDPDADGDYLQTDLVSISNELLGKNGTACISWKGADTNAEMNVIDNNGNEVSSIPLYAAASYDRICDNFIFPAAAGSSVRLRIEAEGDAAIGYYDSALMADANRVNISQVSQATLYGSATYPVTASCLWTDTSSTMEGYDADADCTSPTGSNLVNNALAPATKIPAIRFVNLPYGDYMFKAYGNFKGTEGSSGHTECNWRLYDGTTGTKLVSTEGSTSTISNSPMISGRISYTTTQPDITIQVQYDLIDGTACQVDVTESDFTIDVYRYPLSSQTAYSANTDNKFASTYWAYDAGALAQLSGAAYATFSDADFDDSRTFYGAAESPTNSEHLGIKVSNLKAGSYAVIAAGRMNTVFATAATTCSYSIYDGTSRRGFVSHYTNTASAQGTSESLVGIFTYTSVQPSVEWVVQAVRDSGGGSCRLDFSTANLGFEMTVIPLNQNFPHVNILNSVESSASGGFETATAFIGGNDGTPSVDREAGDWIDDSNIIDNGAGNYTLPFNKTYSVAPDCQITTNTDTGSSCRALTTTTQVQAVCATSAGGVDVDFNLFCTFLK